MHERLSVHQMCFPELELAEYVRQCYSLNAQQLGFISPALLATDGLPKLRRALSNTEMQVQSIAHVFHAGHLTTSKRSWQQDRDNLFQLIDIAAELNGESIYMLTGGHGDLDWEAAAECFSDAIAPCVERAKACGIKLAIENASGLYADLHIAHSLRDTITLAEMADVGICIELFFCWPEAGLRELITRAMPRCHLVQVSDYCYGDRSLPARAVPGDGIIPLEKLIAEILTSGYTGAFDIELLGPRIDKEGAVKAVTRSAIHIDRILQSLSPTIQVNSEV
jgi:sugar phosphate isomerase/epimerase